MHSRRKGAGNRNVGMIQHDSHAKHAPHNRLKHAEKLNRSEFPEEKTWYDRTQDFDCYPGGIPGRTGGGDLPPQSKLRHNKKKHFSDFTSATASLSLSNLDAFLQVLVACEPDYALRPPVQS